MGASSKSPASLLFERDGLAWPYANETSQEFLDVISRRTKNSNGNIGDEQPEKIRSIFASELID